MMPNRSMSQGAFEVTGIKIIDKEMFVHGEKVTTSSPWDGLMQFLFFLKDQNKPCILLAHNGLRFDIPRILNLATSLRLLDEFKVFVKGFCDSLDLFKFILPERKQKKESFNQSKLCSDYLYKADIKDAHNALNDVLMLQKLVTKLCDDKASIIKFTKDINFISKSKERLAKSKEHKRSLIDIPISKSIKNKISKAGIDKSILEKACETGLDALTILLWENVGGKRRVTNNKKILRSIFDYLSKSKI